MFLLPRKLLFPVLDIVQQVPLAVNNVVNLPGSISILPSVSDTNGLARITQAGVDLDPGITGGDDGGVEF